MNLIEIINEVRLPDIKNASGEWPRTAMTIENITKQNWAILDRIKEACLQPRVMKPWTDDCKPIEEGVYWINKERFLISLDKKIIKSGLWRGIKINHWLEVEQEPTLPT